MDAEIDRVAKSYSRRARIPGFRPGKAPARIVKQRFKDQILHDVAHDLIPRTVGDLLRERGVEAVDTPDIRDVTVEEGQPLTFTASFDTLPAFDPGDYTTLSLTRSSSVVEEGAVDQALERLRQRAARYEPVEGRGVDHGDTAVLDLARHDPDGETHTHPDVSIELGASANPPGFDEQILGLEPGASKTFTIHYPADHAVAELADKDVTYTVTIKAIKRRVVPALDDELAKDLGDFATLDALRARVRADLEREARQSAERRAARVADEAARRARAVRGAARRWSSASSTSASRTSCGGCRAGHRPAPDGRRLGGLPREPAGGGPRVSSRGRSCSTKWRGARSSRCPTRTSIGKSSATRPRSDGRCRPCGRGSNRTAGSRGCAPGCGGRSPLTSFSRVLESPKKPQSPSHEPFPQT